LTGLEEKRVSSLSLPEAGKREIIAKASGENLRRNFPAATGKGKLPSTLREKAKVSSWG
jgi:hypothetical protein